MRWEEDYKRKMNMLKGNLAELEHLHKELMEKEYLNFGEKKMVDRDWETHF